MAENQMHEISFPVYSVKTENTYNQYISYFSS